MQNDLERILIDRDRIAGRVRELGVEISRDLEGMEDAEIMLVPVMTGSIIFVADLMRELPLKLGIGLVTVTSYPGTATTSQGARLAGAPLEGLRDRHVLIVDDILDSGGTIRLIRREMQELGARSVRVCVLLRKLIESARDTPCDYVGFDIPDEFVVGYGLDYNDHYRNLPDIGVLRKDVL